jgi:large subunit ribosomal protein L4
MPAVSVVDLNGRATGSMDLEARIFEAPVNEFVLHEVVLMQQAARRQGTASTKTRAVVSGTGKKPYKQKHTGRARAGSIRSPLWRHGGTIFGPLPRGYGYPMPKQKVRGAVRSALSVKARAGQVRIVEDLPDAGGKSKALAQVLKALGMSGRILIVAGGEREPLLRAAANLPGVTVIRPEALNVRDVLLHNALLLSRRDVSRVQELWA